MIVFKVNNWEIGGGIFVMVDGDKLKSDFGGYFIVGGFCI